MQRGAHSRGAQSSMGRHFPITCVGKLTSAAHPGSCLHPGRKTEALTESCRGEPISIEGQGPSCWTLKWAWPWDGRRLPEKAEEARFSLACFLL